MSNLQNVTGKGNRDLHGNRCLSAVTLAINAGSAATFKTTGTTTYIVDGVFKTKAALSAQAFTAGHTPVPPSTTCYFVVGLNAGGTVKTFQGGCRAGKVGKLPELEDGYTPIGIIKIVTNGSTTFTPGTTALDAAGVTATYTDVSVLPAVAP